MKNGRKCNDVVSCVVVIVKREERSARPPRCTLKNAFFFPFVQVWYLGRTTRLPPTSELIAGVNVDYVRRLCICADLYVCAAALLPRTHAYRASNDPNFLPVPPFHLLLPRRLDVRYLVAFNSVLFAIAENDNSRNKEECESPCANDTWIIIIA